ncbi:MAG: transcriptional regulator [SAR324 cluster bacterium]|uniref:Transcriptional regulator n=1 Tax=SAR324 cluster bacterium TaxID=2024889 RepID=A0A2A4TCF6_9DELT|nr:MAG: transcriptional regulator [SAR324 cluster bacterium]
MNEEHCESIVNRVCIEFGFSQKKLADMLDVSEPTIAKWNKGEIPKMANLALGLLLENKKLKEDLEEFTLLKKTLKKVGSLFFSSEN